MNTDKDRYFSTSALVLAALLSAWPASAAPPSAEPAPAGALERSAVWRVIFEPTIQQSPVTSHHFWDRRNLLALGIHGAARALDAHSSCRAFAKDRDEMRLPFINSCAGIIAYSAGAVGTELGFRYWLHRRGKHRLERWLPYFFALPAGIEAGFNYRF